MQLVYVDRKMYRNKNSTGFLDQLHERFGDFYLLPEGGSNQPALTGCAEIVADIKSSFDIIAVACGTGATLAGIVTALNTDQHAIGFAALKGADFLSKDVTTMLAESGHQPAHNWHIERQLPFWRIRKNLTRAVCFYKKV